MPFEILGSFDRKTLFCAGSVTKQLTTFVVLSKLSEKYNLNKILDDEDFLDKICINSASKSFLQLFQQKIIHSKFTLRDLCSFYTGLPYTFDPSDSEIESVDAGKPYKHHSIPDEKTFLDYCENKITPIYHNRNKFHYSEIAIMFLGYLIEKIYETDMETLYKQFVIDKFKLSNSQFSRVRPANVYTQDLSDKYDYAAVAIQDHGYFCYGNGFYTTLDDMKILLENITNDPVFLHMVDINSARSASDNLMNGLATELRVVGDDLIFGYEGLSFSGCNVWSYSNKLKKGYITFCNNEEEAYKIIYDQFGYSTFDKVPAYTDKFYSQFITNYNNTNETKVIPLEYQGNYRRVKINDKELENICVLGNNFLRIRDPDEIQYDLMYAADNSFHIKSSDNTPESKIGLCKAKSGNRYMFYNGSLYKNLVPSSDSLQSEINSHQTGNRI